MSKRTNKARQLCIEPSPCRSCPREVTCGDNWYGCPKWQVWFRGMWGSTIRGYKAKRKNAIPLLYRASKNDREIARAVGISASAVCQWRKHNGLPAVGRRGRPATKAVTEGEGAG